jgi:hypothetical protein
MNHVTIDFDRTEEATLTCEVSDEELEHFFAASARAMPTLLLSSYCFTCGPADGEYR